MIERKKNEMPKEKVKTMYNYDDFLGSGECLDV